MQLLLTVFKIVLHCIEIKKPSNSFKHIFCVIHFNSLTKLFFKAGVCKVLFSFVIRGLEKSLDPLVTYIRWSHIKNGRSVNVNLFNAGKLVFDKKTDFTSNTPKLEDILNFYEYETTQLTG